MARQGRKRSMATHWKVKEQWSICVVAISVIVAGCTPNEYGELHQYNDVWKGTIQIDEIPEIPIELTIALTDHDAEEGRANNGLCQEIYGRLSFLDEGYFLAAAGEASHWDVTAFDWDVLSPQEGQEFIELSLASSVGSEDEPEREAYRSNYQAFVDDIELVEFVRHSLRLVAELEGDELIGFIDEHSTSEVLDEPGEVTVTPKRRGTFRLTRISPLPDDAYGDETTMFADPFVFHTEVLSDCGTAYTISF